jgi:DNA-binding NarL/FixJ family response regulator
MKMNELERRLLHAQRLECLGLLAGVLLDLTMSKMSGEETFRALRGISPDIRVLVSSGYSEDAAAEQFSQLGLAGFIQKPYRHDTLIAKLRAAGDRSKC